MKRTKKWENVHLLTTEDDTTPVCVCVCALQMQQQELALIRQREANMTALAAIGPRKKRKMDSPISGATAEVQAPGAEQPDAPFTIPTHYRYHDYVLSVSLCPGLELWPLPGGGVGRGGLQTVHPPAHHQGQPQGPAFLPGE